ncbi:glycosyltransferase family 2 protein [Hymenobacter setariae]|uniref:glycosyltransferase family 2 protein n=1 Tax=Hymenobacter setariae TaxID=2594794 RepID=UPI001F20F855|nr:glycosyltransferase [Hymenobacter setariae]
MILPVAGHLHRPQWSVMIPAYNCLGYLGETLASVLAQDPGPAHMQIMVVDDCSTDGDVAALVQTIGKGRVDYYRQATNVGSLRNFETCLNRSVGHWVHILHGDDRVAVGFYAEIESLFRDHPEAGAAFTNTTNLTMGATGEKLMDRPPLVPERGIIKDFLFRIAEGQKLETPSIVVKRSVYEQLGGFFAVHYGEDWEMWVRIAARYPIAYSPRCLAQYRYLNSTSISTRYIKEGQNIRDITKVINIIQQYLPSEHRKELKKQALRHYAGYCMLLADSLYYTDSQACDAQRKGAIGMSKHPAVIYLAFKLYTKHLIQYKEIKRFLKKDSGLNTTQPK